MHEHMFVFICDLWYNLGNGGDRMEDETRMALLHNFLKAKIDFQEMALYLHNISKSDRVA